MQMINYIESNGQESKIKQGTFLGLIIGGIVISLIPIPVDGDLLWVGNLIMLFVNLYILFSLYENILSLEDGGSQGALKTTEMTDSIADKDTFIGWALVAIPGIFVLQWLLTTFHLLPFGMNRLVAIVLNLAMWTAPLLISFRLKNPQIKIILMIASIIALLLTLLSIFMVPREMYYY